MSFVDREDVLDVMEQAVVASFVAVGREAPARPFPRLTLRGRDATLRHGQARSPLRRSRSRTRPSSRATPSSASSRTRRSSATSSSPRAFSRAELARLEEIAKEWGAKGLAYLVNDESARSARRSRSSSRSAELDAFRGRAGNDGALRGRRRGARQPGARRPARAPRPRARPRRGRSGRLPLGDRLSALRARRGDAAAGRSSTIRSPRPCPATRTGSSPIRAASSASTTT